ncbi:hydroxyacylglutathione hydrolase domain protein [Candidatus Erwinia dacicola]|uniref:Hydroxyacylglutathione hydrolase domain protein n=1 Tax=Candidatus Erwinia dacicola TaxID=252393 RepID=A0A328TLZ8_9GAMM|nr:hydroxyacylglutathione hydrolase domain protein [Candidatus Erwinia dacicola]
MNFTSILALQDNYIWTLNDEAGHCLIADPSEVAPVLRTLEKRHCCKVIDELAFRVIERLTGGFKFEVQR